MLFCFCLFFRAEAVYDKGSASTEADLFYYYSSFPLVRIAVIGINRNAIHEYCQ